MDAVIPDIFKKEDNSQVILLGTTMEQSKSTISVIISSYERPRHLRYTLLALNRQTVPLYEILVADDGSGEEVRAVIEDFASRANVRTVHVRQKHEDYRLARSRNNAVRAAAGDYLVFVDQDCVPVADFLSAHVSSRREGVFRVGSCVFLDEERTTPLTDEDILHGRFESLIQPSEIKRLRKDQRKDNSYAFFRNHLWPIKAKPKLRGGNFSIHRADLLKVNGFDENYVGWGQEDDDLGRRLYLAGMKAQSVVAAAITFHLHHPPPADATARWSEGRNVPYFRRKNVPFFAEAGVQKPSDATPEDVRVTVYP